ncbi:MAG: histidinol dehydrogenase, partial [Paracoccaceae bacterium]
MPMFLSITEPEFESRFTALLSMKREEAEDVDQAVAAIISDVRSRGDAAVLDLTARYDRMELSADRLAFTPAEISAEIAKVSRDDRAALALAADRIRAYHERQRPQDESWTDAAGATLGWRWTPVSAAGLYVPGGLASYPSSVL